MIFYFSVVLYITSVITALVLMILGKNMGARKFFMLSAVHFGFFAVFLASLFFLKPAVDTPPLNYFFLLFVCTGVMLSGLVWRIHVPRPARFYFSIFIVTFPLFLFSPSMLVNFLLTARYTDTLGKVFPVSGNYMLEPQNSWSTASDNNKYKLVRKQGIYRQTIARDILFGGKLDSIKVIRFTPGDKTVIRGYWGSITYVSAELDSTDAEISLIPRRPNSIQRKL